MAAHLSGRLTACNLEPYNRPELWPFYFFLETMFFFFRLGEGARELLRDRGAARHVTFVSQINKNKRLFGFLLLFMSLCCAALSY